MSCLYLHINKFKRNVTCSVLQGVPHESGWQWLQILYQFVSTSETTIRMCREARHWIFDPTGNRCFIMWEFFLHLCYLEGRINKIICLSFYLNVFAAQCLPTLQSSVCLWHWWCYSPPHHPSRCLDTFVLFQGHRARGVQKHFPGAWWRLSQECMLRVADLTVSALNADPRWQRYHVFFNKVIFCICDVGAL